MARRFYLCQIVQGGPGDGLHSVLEELLPGKSISSVDGRADGTLTSGWMLSFADVTDAEHDTIKADARVRYLPFEDALGNPLGLADVLELIPLTLRDQLKAAYEGEHVPTHDFTLTTTVRQALRRLVRRCILRQLLAANDYTEGLDTQVKDMSGPKRNAINSRLTELGFDTSVISNNDTIREALRKLHAQAVKWNGTGFD